ncbi:hypothetical protein PMIN01_03901 [Paraphaeosphaeria minitans]|uniref:Uncharacterized protein n=1 Tax=Paraphaeosphaeria minitans TaxID=565426 RepID=A0A9P6GNG3_9PLEO|nr:hypothetical protein PMIN01_03901 [Paraphaeosphaeria minitans]
MVATVQGVQPGNGWTDSRGVGVEEGVGVEGPLHSQVRRVCRACRGTARVVGAIATVAIKLEYTVYCIL